MTQQFSVTSTSLSPGGFVPEQYLGQGCDGDNVSPELEWTGAPSETKSFAVTVFDPDARSGHGWWHWTVVNIPNNVNKLEEGASNLNKLPKEAIEIQTDFHNKGYGGPCPPKGHSPHRYIFTVYAMGTENLNVDPNSTAEILKDRLEKSCLAKADFTVKYGR